MLGPFIYAGRMHTEIKHLAKLFQGVREIREVVAQDCHFPDMEATSIDDLQHGFEAYFGKKIRFFVTPDLKDELLRGVYMPYGKNVFIYLDKSLPENWLKYIQVKEMCNLILDGDEYKTDDPTLLLELMIYEEAAAPLDGDAPLDLVSDYWAKYAAHELLFPFECREKAKASLGNTETLFSLAEKFGVPEHVVEICLSEKYNALCKQAWEMTSQ